MTVLVAIPASAAGKFRMSEVDMQELWKFALACTKTYGERLERELDEMTNESPLRTTAVKDIQDIKDSFWRSKFRQDSAALASAILSDILGGDIMLETLEDTDATMIIEPIFDESLEHLHLWGRMR